MTPAEVRAKRARDQRRGNPALVGDWDRVTRVQSKLKQREWEKRKMATFYYDNPQYFYVTNVTSATTATSNNWFPTAATNASMHVQAFGDAVRDAAFTIKQYQVPQGTTTISIPQFNDQHWAVAQDAVEQQRRLSPPREFNRYVNASDLMEEFIQFLGTEGVRQSEFMALPVELFIKWLIIRACEEDREEPPVRIELPARPPQPRCLGCQRFMARRTKVPLHGSRCAEIHFARQSERGKIPA